MSEATKPVLVLNPPLVSFPSAITSKYRSWMALLAQMNSTRSVPATGVSASTVKPVGAGADTQVLGALLAAKPCSLMRNVKSASVSVPAALATSIMMPLMPLE